MVATTIEATITDLLKGSAGLSGLIGSGDNARVYPVQVPQGQKSPCIVFRLMDSERPRAFGRDTGICRSRYEFTCWSTTKSIGTAQEAQDVAEGLRQAMQRYRDVAGTYGVEVQDCFLYSQSEYFDQEVEAFAVVVDYEIIWREGN